MTGSRQRQITKSGRGTDGRFLSGIVPANKTPSYRPELVGEQFGSVVVMGEDVNWIGGYRHVWVRCVGCGAEKWINLDNLLKQKTRGCQSCSQTTHPLYRWLRRRLEAARRRCQNSDDKKYRRYGGRGVKFKWVSVREAVLWVLANMELPAEPDRRIEIDRRNNNGHYEPGNLRFASRAENSNNRENTFRVRIAGKLLPLRRAFYVFRDLHPEVRYADHTLRRLLREMSVERIVQRWAAPSCKPKGVYGTYSTRDPEGASRSPGSL